VGVVVGLVLLLVAVRMIFASAAPAQQGSSSNSQTTASGAAAPHITREELLPPGSNTSQAQPAAAPTRHIQFSARPVEPSYTIVAGDSLWTIAQKNRTTVEAIQSINNLPGNVMLRVGQQLVMP
jgi:LysM repeat protein